MAEEKTGTPQATAAESNKLGYKPAIRFIDAESGRITRRAAPGETAEYIVPLSSFARPTISIPGGLIFEWPLSAEGFRIQGSASLAIHRYLDGENVMVDVLHRDEGRITMSGVFPGVTGILNANALEMLCVAPQPPGGKILTLPGIYNNQQLLVVAESWEFDRAEDAKDDSMAYQVVFVKIGTGATVKPLIKPVVSTPTTGGPSAGGDASAGSSAGSAVRGNRGAPIYSVTVRGNLSTLRAIAALPKVYGNASRWRDLYELNYSRLQKLDIPDHKLPTAILPAGMKIYY